jgi:hypothetical protein
VRLNSGQTTLNVVRIESTAKNVALIEIANNCSGSSFCTNDGSDLTVQDVAAGTNLSVLTDPFVAMYVLGDTDFGHGREQSKVAIIGFCFSPEACS